jgi:hypothetical protein
MSRTGFLSVKLGRRTLYIGFETENNEFFKLRIALPPPMGVERKGQGRKSAL